MSWTVTHRVCKLLVGLVMAVQLGVGAAFLTVWLFPITGSQDFSNVLLLCAGVPAVIATGGGLLFFSLIIARAEQNHRDIEAEMTLDLLRSAIRWVIGFGMLDAMLLLLAWPG